MLERSGPLDPNELGKRIVDLATEKDPFAVVLGRRGGLKGGKARAAKMSSEERSEAARKAANARWSKTPAPSDYSTPLRQAIAEALDELKKERARIDADIADLERIIARADKPL